MPANAPAGSDSSEEREVLRKIIDAWSALAHPWTDTLIDAILAAGFTRRAQPLAAPETTTGEDAKRLDALLNRVRNALLNYSADLHAMASNRSANIMSDLCADIERMRDLGFRRPTPPAEPAAVTERMVNAGLRVWRDYESEEHESLTDLFRRMLQAALAAAASAERGEG